MRVSYPYTIRSSGVFNVIVKVNPYQTVNETHFDNNIAFIPINIDAAAWAAQNLPYPIIFVHGINSDNKTWNTLIDSLKNYYGWSFGGNMNFSLNYDNDFTTSNLINCPTGNDCDYHDYTVTSDLQKSDFYTVNFDVNFDGIPYSNSFLNQSNQSAIVKQGLAIRDAIKHVLTKTGRDKVIIVGHSMGGLAAREYLQNADLFQSSDNKKHVAKLLTTGTPHGGTNFTNLALLPGFLPDMASEAARDMRATYFYSNNDGVYLFSGTEDNLYMLNQIPENYHNVDVNCNGLLGEWITGINDKFIPTDLSYACIISNGILGGDGAVIASSANINNYLPVNADTFHLQQVLHTQLTSNFKSIIKGLDESNSWAGAYQISSEKLYYGLITEQSKGRSVVTDYDTYKINIPSNGNLNIQVYDIQLPQFSVQVYNSSHTSIYSTNSNGKGCLNVDIPSLPAGTFYVAFYGTPTSTTMYYPYAFKVTYSSTPSSYCSGTTNLTTPSGTFSDGSGSNNYNNNSDCKWKIQPSGATSITLSFTNFNVSDPGDTVYAYNGSTTSSPLLGKWAGTTLPTSVTSTGGTMLVRFVTDATNTAAGWTANYSAVVVPTYCNGITTFTAASGSFSDGSGATDYGNNSHCSWLINPTDAYSVTLNFSFFNTEAVNDVVNVYDGSDNTTTLLGSFSGNSIPSSLTSTGGAMFVEFITNETITNAGWNAFYTSYIPYSGAGIVEYQYWFDNNYANAVSIPIAPQNNFQLNSNVPLNTLSKGLHTFSIRFKSNTDVWSSATTTFFYNADNTVPGNIVQYEYWYDNDYANKSNVSLANTTNLFLSDSLNTNNTVSGLHTLNMRFKTSGSIWSSTISSFFYKPDISTGGSIVQYEYWYDNDYGNKSNINLSGTNNLLLLNSLNTTNVELGLHTLNIRFKTNGSSWSGAISSFFYKTNNMITGTPGYEYWFDNNYAGKTNVTVNSTNNLFVFDSLITTGLTTGLHTFNIRLRPDGSKWSSAVFSFFYKSNEEISPGQAQYEYWFDSNYVNKININISSTTNLVILDSILTTGLNLGSHTLNMRFKPNGGNWSSAISDFFNENNTSPDQLCPGGSTFLTSNLNGTNYQWQINNGNGYINISDNVNYVGTNASSLQLINIPSSWYGYQLRCVVDGNYSNTNTLRFRSYWKGTVSNAWENVSNWSCGQMPDEYTDVIVSGPAPFYPVLNTNTSCRSIIVNPAITVTITNGHTLNLTGK